MARRREESENAQGDRKCAPNLAKGEEAHGDMASVRPGPAHLEQGGEDVSKEGRLSPAGDCFATRGAVRRVRGEERSAHRKSQR